MTRAKADSDPENVTDQLSVVSDELLGGPSDVIAFREMWYHLQENGSAASQELKDVGWTASEDGLQKTYSTRGDWWSRVGDPIFRMLPGVIPPSEAPTSTRLLHRLPDIGLGRGSGSSWRYDETGRNWPTPPADAVALSDEALDEVLQAADVPGRTGREEARSRIPLGKMYRHLEENGSASAAELKNNYTVKDPHHDPEQGIYDSADGWFRDVGRPVLSEIPGIAPPRELGDEWRFIGVSPGVVEQLSG